MKFSWKDSKGNTWDMTVNGATLLRVKALLDINILDLSDYNTKVAKRFNSDPVFMIDVLWAVCAAQAGERGINDEQFAELLLGDVLDNAVERLQEALINFIPNPTLRKAQMDLLKHQRRAGQIISTKYAEKMNDPELEKLLNKTASSFIETSLSTAELLESTPEK